MQILISVGEEKGGGGRLRNEMRIGLLLVGPTVSEAWTPHPVF